MKDVPHRELELSKGSLCTRYTSGDRFGYAVTDIEPQAPLREKSLSQLQKEQLTAIHPSIEIDETALLSPFILSQTEHLPAQTPTLSVDPSERRTPLSRTEPSLDDHEVARRRHEEIRTSSSTVVCNDTYSDLSHELAYYKKRCETMEGRCQRMQIERRQMQSSYEESNGVPEKLSNLIHQVVERNVHLKKRLNDQLDLEPYLTHENTSTRPSTAHQVISLFQSMKEELLSIRIFKGSHKPLITRFHGASIDLDSLLATVGVGVQARTEETLGAIPASSLGELLRALTGAAVHRWIFESEFQSHIITVTPLLQKYRDCITTWCTYPFRNCRPVIHTNLSKMVTNAFAAWILLHIILSSQKVLLWT